MKKIGIIFAMKEELEALKKHLKITNEYNIFELKFYESTLKNIELILVESGVGKVNAARTTQILIDNMKADYIFNIGVAGGIANNLKIGDIIVGTKMVQHDFDITSFNHEKGFIPNVGTFIKTDEYLRRIVISVLKNTNISFYEGVIASGDIFCTEVKMCEKIHHKFNALCIEMEGAAVAQVSNLSLIPFIVIKSISDIPNNDNTVTYENFLSASAKNVANILYKVLLKL